MAPEEHLGIKRIYQRQKETSTSCTKKEQVKENYQINKTIFNNISGSNMKMEWYLEEMKRKKLEDMSSVPKVSSHVI